MFRSVSRRWTRPGTLNVSSVVSALLSSVDLWHTERRVRGKVEIFLVDDIIFTWSGGKAYCDKCYTATILPKCAGCSQAIQDRALKAFDAQWHVQCFVCEVRSSEYSHEKRTSKIKISEILWFSSNILKHLMNITVCCSMKYFNGLKD